MKKAMSYFHLRRSDNMPDPATVGAVSRNIQIYTVKKILLIQVTLATVLCTLEPLSMLSATHQYWLPMEDPFLALCGVTLIIATILLWSRFAWVLPIVVPAYLVFGSL